MPYLISRTRNGGQINIKNAQHKVALTLDDDNHSKKVDDIQPMIESLTILKDAGFIKVEEVAADGDAENERLENERLEAERLENERLEAERLAAEGGEGKTDDEDDTTGENGKVSVPGEGDTTDNENEDTKDAEGDAIVLPLEVRPEDPEVAKATIVFAMKQVIAEGKELTNDNKPQMDALRKALGFVEVTATERDEFMPLTVTTPAE